MEHDFITVFDQTLYSERLVVIAFYGAFWEFLGELLLAALNKMSHML